MLQLLVPFLVGAQMVTAASASPAKQRICVTPPTFGTPIEQADVPLVITTPGSYFVTENLTQTDDSLSLIEVQVDGVTIDLNGFSLTGLGSGSRAAIEHTNSVGSGLVVRAGSIAGMGGGAISAGTISACIVEDLAVTSCGPAPAIHVGQGCQIENCKIQSPAPGGSGILVGGSSVVRDCSMDGKNSLTSASDGLYGIAAADGGITIQSSAVRNVTSYGFAPGDHSIVETCIAENVGAQGYLVADGANLRSCVVKGSGSDGFSCATGVTLTGCTASETDAHGFSFVDACTLSSCTVQDAALSGYFMGRDCVLDRCTARTVFVGFEGDEGNSLTSCSASGATTGYLLGTGNLLRDSNARQLTGSGFDLGDGTIATGCNVQGSGASGFRAAQGVYLGQCISSNSMAAGFRGSEGVMYESCIAHNTVGSSFVMGQHSIARGCYSDENTGAAGFVASNDSTLESCQVTNSSGPGITGGRAVAVRKCDVRNSGRGISLGNGAVIESSSVMNNQGIGFTIADNGFIRDSDAYGNTIGAQIMDYGRLDRCSIRENTITGVDLTPGIRSMLENCDITGNPLAWDWDPQQGEQHVSFRNRFRGNGNNMLASNPDDVVMQAGQVFNIPQGTNNLDNANATFHW